MNNILYLDDYINLYIKKDNKILVIKPYKNTLKNGKIIDREKFINKMNKVIKENKLGNNFINNTIDVIISALISKEDKKIIEASLEELNYKKINFMREINYLKLNNDTIYLNCNEEYFYFYYNDFQGKTKVKVYENDEYNKKVIGSILKLFQRDVYLYGKNVKEMLKILEQEKINYYYFEDSYNLIFSLILRKV